MAFNGENNAMRVSQLRPPSRIPATPGKGLLEMSASDNNARATQMMPPPNAMKHKVSGRKTLSSPAPDKCVDDLVVPEPAPKRKTLVERAGDLPRPVTAAPPSSKPVNGAVKATVHAGVRNTSSGLSRAPSGASRNTSANSFTTANGSRPPSATGNYRPQTSMGVGRPAKNSISHPTRPDSALDQNDSPNGASALLTKRKAWDTKGRLEDMELLYSQLKSQMEGATTEKSGLEETLTLYKTRLNELEQIRLQLSASNQTLSAEMQETKASLSAKTMALEDATRNHTFEVDDLRRKHRNDMEDTRDQHWKELEKAHRDARDEEELAEKERELKVEIEGNFAVQRQTADLDLSQKDREMTSIKNEFIETKSSLDRANATINNLQEKLAEASANTLSLETSMRAMKAKIDFLESDNQQQSQAFAAMEQKMQDAENAAAEAYAKLRAEETLRRKLHNQVQELKGNIRVFCRVRPTLSEESDDRAEIGFPDADTDCKEVAIQGPEQKSAMGNISKSTSAFSFDRVFSPSSQNAEIFEEISQLVQSALDGYNVCIFCYGQTGSGKTYTMSSLDGMIPRTVTQIYETAKSLEEKGWKYTMEGSFIEVYNETLNDLLGKAEEWEKKKHEIRHDAAKGKTTVTDVAMVQLDSPSKVNSILEDANRNRRVAATKANSRSSRSHSVFILKLTGENHITGERSEGTLNLVDLAGSERLSHSGVTGDRLKETQNINKSLSCLGDVISALGQGKEGGHVPYRNSKLTYLLQYSLGGNSKTLMFVMISPLQAHLSETLTSLKFATKVHNTHIGTAKRQSKVKD
ncbi:kinesin-like nuclear fusion protein [Taxawa tesnikishii (nom. ined.)]|nr:kinesin-like nuclear fusion protein [Dothideales sp. JES 119]